MKIRERLLEEKISVSRKSLCLPSKKYHETNSIADQGGSWATSTSSSSDEAMEADRGANIPTAPWYGS